MATRLPSRTDEVEHSQTQLQDPGMSLQALKLTRAFSYCEPNKLADVERFIKYGPQMKQEPLMEDLEAGAMVNSWPTRVSKISSILISTMTG